MSERESINVSVTYGRNKRGTFVFNGKDISDSVHKVQVEILAGKIAFVTFTLRTDDLELDVDGVEGEAQE